MTKDGGRIVSSSRLPHTRRPQYVAPDQQRRTLEKVKRYMDVAVDEDGLVNDDTKAHRQWLMRIWNSYFSEKNVDPASIWVGLCEGSKEATAWTKAFFSDYVENSVRSVMVLGPEEYEDRRMLNSASTVLAMWRKLVKEADLTALKIKRHEEPWAGDKWRLRFHGHTARMPTSSIATFEVSKWLWTNLAAEARLTKQLTFEKVEATSDDVLVVLRTLWERAADLGIDAKTRISFHAEVLLSAMGGFRPGCLGKVCYKDIDLSILRDPQHPCKVKQASTITIKRNKLKDSLSVSKADKVKFSVFFVPFPLVCLGRLIVSRAIQDDAFDPGFMNAKEFLTRPLLGDVDYISLKWKEEMLERPVFGLSYRRFNNIWHRVCQAAGFRVEPRLYALRVGAGARLDEHPLFSNALRNYILSHTNNVFESQYQTSRIREDLMQAAFGARTGSDNSPLFAQLRNISLSRDMNAPIDIAPTEWAEFEARKDVAALRAAIVEARHEDGSKFLETLKSRIKYLRHSWKSLKLADNRRKYFEFADRSRAQGQQPLRDESKPSNQTAEIRARQSNAQMANQVLQHIVRRWNTSSDDEDPGRYIHLLVAYLNRCSKVNLDIWEEEDEEEAGEDENEENRHEMCDGDDDGIDLDSVNNDHREKQQRLSVTKKLDQDGFQCVICDLKFRSRVTLTGHYDKHKRANFFESPFKCPACRQDGVNTTVEKGFQSWVRHIEKFHGAQCTPYSQQSLKYAEIYPCPLTDCGTQRRGKRYNSRGLIAHFAQGHADRMDAQKTDNFEDAIRCTRCGSSEQAESGAPLINSISGWKSHFDVFHSSEKQVVFQCFICLEQMRTGRGLKSHLHNLHESKQNFFANAFPCPECIRAGHQEAPEIRGRQAWQEHVEHSHNGGAKEKSLNSSLCSPEATLHYPCLICSKCHTSRGALTHHLNGSHDVLFKEDFHCPACLRQGKRDSPPFNLKSLWIKHVTHAHQGCSTDSTTCLCPRPADKSFSPPVVDFGRSKRVKLGKSDLEPDTEIALSILLPCYRDSEVSADSSSGKSGDFQSLHKGTIAYNIGETKMNSVIFRNVEDTSSRLPDLLDLGSKRKRGAKDLEVENVLTLRTALSSTVERVDIPIDPYLLALG